MRKRITFALIIGTIIIIGAVFITWYLYENILSVYEDQALDSGQPITPICGNGVKDAGEQCDSSDLGGQTCQTLGYTNGTLSCNVDCTFNVDACFDVSEPSTDGTTGGGSSGGGGGGGGGAGGGGGTGGGTGGTADGEQPATDSTICQNAQNNGLCDGLDLTYGEGYKELCCSEHNLCC